MAHYWFIVTLSWIGSVSLQYIGNTYPDQLTQEDATNINSLDPVLNPVQNLDYFNSAPPMTNLDRNVKEPMLDILFPQLLLPSLRVRRTPEVAETEAQFTDADDAGAEAFVPNDSRISTIPLLIQKYEGFTGAAENNASEDIGQKLKRSFSPWGGKRDGQSTAWTWKRATMREPSMPKRVRFSPWGGKRSSQLIFKPGAKALKIIFSKTLPDLTRIISHTPGGSSSFKIAGFEVVPAMGKRNPVRILALTSKLDEKSSNKASPLRAFIESMKIYKPGHPYSEVNLRKDDKRKVKFSAWGGKRSPPIIGPIWSPSTQTIQDHTLDKILYIRKGQDVNENMI